jgi:hypothetical protein
MMTSLFLPLLLAAPPDVSFPAGDAARAAVVDDASDPYFGRLQPHEMEAKTGRPVEGKTLEAKREECRKRYMAAVREFTDAEKALLRKSVEKLHPHLEEHYPALAALPWSFLKLDDAVEGGMPHTRGVHVVLPARLLKALGGLGANADRILLPLLAHEQLHVFQRLHPRHGDGLYTELWGFRRAEDLKEIDWLEARSVVNPDATDLGWAFRAGDRWIWPRVIFRRLPKAPGDILDMPGDFQMAAVELEEEAGALRVKAGKDGTPEVGELLEVGAYTRVFAGSTYIYHPAEAAADLFAKIIAADLLGAPVNPKLEPVRTWFRENLRRTKERD